MAKLHRKAVVAVMAPTVRLVSYIFKAHNPLRLRCSPGHRRRLNPNYGETSNTSVPSNPSLFGEIPALQVLALNPWPPEHPLFFGES